MEKAINRCGWVGADSLYETYHDEEWGVPIRDERKLFEMLCLEGAQAGLSWITVLRKRENYREAFDGFDPEKMAHYGEEKVAQLLENEGIIRHRGKIEAFIGNAKAYLRMKQEGEDFSAFIWSFVDDSPVINEWKSFKDAPTATVKSEAMSKALKKRGFKFVGGTICYAFMQAVGLVNDHEKGCMKRSL
jgi:DNA-3-methyladenine glycosylase I